MKIATLDLETDPFCYGRMPAPFAAGIYDGKTFVQFWGDDCIAQACEYLKNYPEKLTIFAHNGGKFDWYFFEHVINAPLQIVDGRLIKGRLFHHEIRDSLKLLPTALGAYNKTPIDYACFERNKRERHRQTIIAYLRDDCIFLHEYVSAFVDKYGDKLTIGAAAIDQVQKFCGRAEHLTAAEDARYRPFFFGGRVQCFEQGILRGDWKIYDVNSMYPAVMATHEHPLGLPTARTDMLPESAPFYLAEIDATSKGALPLKIKNELCFPHARETYFATSHEIRMAQELGMLKIHKVKSCVLWNNTRNFKPFVDFFAAEKLRAEKENDKAGRLFAKLIMNNAYGKFAQNPARFQEHELFASIADCESQGYAAHGVMGDRILGQRKPPVVRNSSFYNVSVAASITGAARATLLRALRAAERPIYCDTDSIICTHLPDSFLHPSALGRWKCEAVGDRAAIAAKKIYAVFDGETCTKHASKGARLTPDEILRVARGETVTYHNFAPSLSVGQSSFFITRQIKMT